jgi:methionyl-tRNA formyltransferase
MSSSIVFMGTPQIAAQVLESLIKDYPIKAVVTQPDRPKGRGLEVTPSPVKSLALSLGLEVLQPIKTRDTAFIERLKIIKPDLVIVVAYGAFLKEEMIKIPSLGCINLHSSLLPKYRGATPVQWAVMNGEKETGWTTFYIDQGMDSGDIILQRKIPIESDENAESLFNRMIPLGIQLLKETVDLALNNRPPRRKQNEAEASFAPRLTKADGEVQWDQPAHVIVNRIRGLIPWPVAFTYLSLKGKRCELRLFKAKSEPGIPSRPGEIIRSDSSGLLVGAGQDGIWIEEVQLEGARRMNVQDFLRGHPIPVGTKLGI